MSCRCTRCLRRRNAPNSRASASRRFPRGMGWLAVLVVVLTQAAVVFLICKYGMVDLPLATPLIIESGVVGG